MAPLARFIEALEHDGCVIVKEFTDPATLNQAGREVKPWLDGQGEGAKVGDGHARAGSQIVSARELTAAALQGQTRTVTRLIGRSATVREKFFADDLYQELCEHFLARETTHYYDDEPGLHRDDKNHHARHRRADQYEKGRDILLGLFVPACDTTWDNGATRVVPGSHLWGDEKPELGPDGTLGVVDAEMRMGEAMIMLGSLYHARGAYAQPVGLAKEGAHESRTVHAMFSCTGVHRQEEISFLSYPVDEVKTYSKLVQDRLGWRQSEPNLGWVDLRSPEYLLGGT